MSTVGTQPKDHTNRCGLFLFSAPQLPIPIFLVFALCQYPTIPSAVKTVKAIVEIRTAHGEMDIGVFLFVRHLEQLVVFSQAPLIYRT